MNILEKFQSMTYDTTSLGLIRSKYFEPYFCTPLESIIIASLGVDGIHYCVLTSKGELDLDSSTVYVVNPMNQDHLVEPIAENIKVFLDLVVTTKDAGALECISYMTEEEYNEYLRTIDNSDIEKINIINSLIQTFDLCEYADVYKYVKNIQNNKRFRNYKFSDEFYRVSGLDR